MVGFKAILLAEYNLLIESCRHCASEADRPLTPKARNSNDRPQEAKLSRGSRLPRF